MSAGSPCPSKSASRWQTSDYDQRLVPDGPAVGRSLEITPHGHMPRHDLYAQRHISSGQSSPMSHADIAPPTYFESVQISSGELTPSSLASSSTSRQRIPVASPPPSLSLPGKLPKPVAIPATHAKIGSPFLRAYPPILSNFDISPDAFLQFLDGLNRAAVASPPIQILGLAGGIVSMVPLQTTQIVGGAINAAAKVGTAAISKGRVEMCLREANKAIFGPKGLKAAVAKLDALAVVAKMPILGPDGRVDRDAPVLQDFGDDSMPVQHRRIRALEPWTEHLEVVDLPAIEQSSSPLGKMHAFASERQRRQEEGKLAKQRSKELKKNNEKADKELSKLQKQERKARKRGNDGKLDRIEDERERLQARMDGRTESSGASKADEKLLRKICFLIVTNVEGQRVC
ncbi:hypothetical protein AAL_05865 [Moelleriella libera RCEF 2490]|uniref:Uncharacterized protein n=1 Tax=Moelleriella libera RCEF 2490 TaxID=1081109 RepID=A0A162IFW8_9HYPO|nr:hypothetical protein AAL_05865 [Moelleriella libera RCEF 2490]